MTVFVTGGAGFIGSNFVLEWLKRTDETIINIDLLTYSGNQENLKLLEEDGRHIFVEGNINDSALLLALFNKYRPRAVVNFAAETHVDRSISCPEIFVETNIMGTFTLLEESKKYWEGLNKKDRNKFRFIQISTDEVFGTLTSEAPPFSEQSNFKPNSPYSASKAAADHLARAYYKTYNFPVITTNCSNNYGPMQFPEKLIPLTILNCLKRRPIPIYGDGSQIRDWLHVYDHCSAVRALLAEGQVGETYLIGGNNEITNLEVVNIICDVVDESQTKMNNNLLNSCDLITFVQDRPGHDTRYAIDAGKISSELKWKPQMTFASGITQTVNWYLENSSWIRNTTDQSHSEQVKE